MSDLEGKISQFVAVTGCTADVAKRYLDACAGNLDMAVGMHVENDITSSSFGALPLPSDTQTTKTNSVPQEPVLSPKSYEKTYVRVLLVSVGLVVFLTFNFVIRHGVRAPIPQTSGVLIEQEQPTLPSEYPIANNSSVSRSVSSK